MSDEKKPEDQNRYQYPDDQFGRQPTVEKVGNFEVFQYPDKPDGKKGLRGFRLIVKFD